MTATPGPATNRPIKVIHVVTRLNVGGLPVVVVLLVRHLGPPEFESLLVSGRVEPGDREGDMGYYATDRGVQPIYIDCLSRHLSMWNDLRAFVALYRLFRRERPDVVHTHQAKSGLLGRPAAWLAGVPVRLHTYHGHATRHARHHLSRVGSTIYEALERWLARITTCIVTLSEDLRRELLGLHVGRPEQYEVQEYGLELSRFAETPRYGGVLRRELGLTDEAPLVGFCGRLQPVKRPDLVVDLAARVHQVRPDAHFVMIGDGELRPDLEQQIRDLGVGDVVHLLGLRTDVPLLMADLDVLVNVAFMEGTPVVIMEAGAAGVPSIASRVGGCGDMIEEGVTGWLFEFEDQSTATAKVLAALADREATQTVGRQAQEYYLSQNSSADEMAVRHGELYQRLLAARGRR